MRTCSYTEKFLHTDSFTHRGFHSKKLLHTEARQRALFGRTCTVAVCFLFLISCSPSQIIVWPLSYWWFVIIERNDTKFADVLKQRQYVQICTFVSEVLSSPFQRALEINLLLLPWAYRLSADKESYSVSETPSLTWFCSNIGYSKKYCTSNFPKFNINGLV